MMPEVLVIREKDRFSEILTGRGFSVINFPLIKTVAIAENPELEKCLAEIEGFDGIFLTSASAAEIFLAELHESGRKFQGKFFVLGNRSREILKKYGYEAFGGERATTAAGLLETIPEKELRGKKLLFPCGDRSLRVIPEKLEMIADLREVVVYKTVASDADAPGQAAEIGEKLETSGIACICFFSPSGVEEFLKRFANFSQNRIGVAAIGQTTASFAASKNLRVDLVASTPEAGEFADELTTYLRKKL